MRSDRGRQPYGWRLGQGDLSVSPQEQTDEVTSCHQRALNSLAFSGIIFSSVYTHRRSEGEILGLCYIYLVNSLSSSDVYRPLKNI